MEATNMCSNFGSKWSKQRANICPAPGVDRVILPWLLYPHFYSTHSMWSFSDAFFLLFFFYWVMTLKKTHMLLTQGFVSPTFPRGGGEHPVAIIKTILLLTTLELHQFCILDSKNMFYGSKDRSLCVLASATKKCCIGITIHKLHACFCY